LIKKKNLEVEYPRMKKFSAVQIAVFVILVLALSWWWMRGSKKPGDGIVIVTPMPLANYSIDDNDVFDDDGVPDVLPASVTMTPEKETYNDMEHEGFAVFDSQVDKDWMVHPEEAYDDYSPTDFKSDLLD